MVAAPPAKCDLSNLRWMRDIMRDDPPLADLIYDLQSISYRRNPRTLGQVWPKQVFLERAKDYGVVGRLPVCDSSHAYPTAEECLAANCGFLLVRGLQGRGSQIGCLKISGVAGTKFVILKAIAELRELGLPVVAAAEAQVARIARRVGYESLPAGIARKVIPLVAPLFVQAPWSFQGVTAEGEVLVTNPNFRDPSSEQIIVHQKRVFFTPSFFPWLLQQSCFSGPLRFAFKSVASACHWLPGTLSDNDLAWLDRHLAIATS